MILDAQFHCWEGSDEYPAPPDFAAVHGARFTIDQALHLMDEYGVDAAVLVPLMRWKTGPTMNGYSLQATRAHPHRFAVMGQFDFDSHDRQESLQSWRGTPGMLGIRYYFRDDAERITDGTLDWFFEGLEAYDIPLMTAAPTRMLAFETILAKFPDLRLIFDHAGREVFRLGPERVWNDLDETLALARFPNVAIKVTSLPNFSSEPYPFPSLHEPIRRIYDSFGPQRMLWGSDATRLKWGYKANFELYSRALDFLSDEDRNWIFGRAAMMALKWPIPELADRSNHLLRQ